jgi:hypothetical protein
VSKAQESPGSRHGERETAASGRGDQSDLQSDLRPWDDLFRRGLFETVIVAVGVFLALAVDEWRERSEERQLADEARAALHSELLSNRESVVARLRRTSQLYVQAAAHPHQVGQFVFERRNRPLQLTDGAWAMTVETGAIRWLDATERTRIAEVYAGYERMRDVVFEEMVRWTELAAFSSAPASEELQGDRDRAIRVWQAFAQRAQMAQCVNAGRHERALGAQVGERELSNFCAGRKPEEDPASIYREWRRLGWTSSIPPRTLTEAPAGARP